MFGFNTLSDIVSIRSSWDCATDKDLTSILFTFSSTTSLDNVSQVWTERLVILEQSPGTDENKSCVLYLECNPNSTEKIVCIEVQSEARTMEVYADQEYCGTSRGENTDFLKISENESVSLYKTRLSLERPAASCEVKLLSIGGKKKVAVALISLLLTTVAVKPSGVLSSLGRNIDLERVQTIVGSVGSTLSPGAQRLMSMVQSQQKNPAALGGFLQDVLGTSELAGLGSRPTSLGLAEQSINGPFSKTTGLSDSVIQSSNHHDSEFQLNTKNLPFVKDLKSLEQNALFSGTDLKTKVSSVLDGHLKEQQILCSADMLPFLQNICSQVRQLRVGDKPNTSRQNGLSEDESFTDFRKEPQLCAYVEKIISKHLAQMEQRLTDYIDQRIGRLQEHLDATVLSVVNLLQSCPVETVKENDFSKLITNGEV